MGFNVIDQIIVGLLGADAVAAVGLSNSVASIALLLYASAGVGAGVMVARAFRAQRPWRSLPHHGCGPGAGWRPWLDHGASTRRFFPTPLAAGGRRPKADRQCRYLLSALRCVDRPDDLERGHQCGVPVVKCATHPFRHYERCRGA